MTLEQEDWGGRGECARSWEVTQKRAPKTGLREAGMLQRITDAIYESAETGEAVHLE